MSTAATFFDGRLRFEAGAFVYAGHTMAYSDVTALEFKQKTYSVRDGDTTRPMHETRLRLVLKSGHKLTIRPDGETGRYIRSHDKTVHDAMARAADWLGAYTFDSRMDRYVSAIKTKGYASWGQHQITDAGDLFCKHAYCMNLRDADVRCILYPFHMACMKRPHAWWKRWLMALLNTSELVDLQRDRDCFLYFARRRLGLEWGNETLRVYRGVYAQGAKPQPGPEKAAEAGREAGGSEGVPPPPPPQPKAMPTHVQHLATLGLGPDAAWEDVKIRYRQLVRVHHPDLLRGKGAKDAAIRQAEETLKAVNEAHGWLEDFYRMKKAPTR